MHYGSDKRHIMTGGNVHLADIKNYGVMRPRKEQIPSSLVRFDALRLQRRRDIEHQHVGSMVAKDAIEIFSTDCACPVLNQAADCSFVFRVVAHLEFLSLR